MKTLVVLYAVFMFGHSYPMRVRIVSVHTQTRGSFSQEDGYGDIAFATGHPVAGFQYVSYCNPFPASHGQDFYWGRLEEDQTRLVLAMEHVGSDKPEECTLKISLKPFLYTADGLGNIGTAPTWASKSPGN